MRRNQPFAMTGSVPDWVPHAARVYLAHTEQGCSMRAIARSAGCHASTVLRHVRRVETRRDDLLVDEALRRLSAALTPTISQQQGIIHVTATREKIHDTANDTAVKKLERSALRVLRRMSEPGACMALAPSMENAIVLRETSSGDAVRTAIVERQVAEAMALKDWIACIGGERILRYRITSAGRAALKRFLIQQQNRRQGAEDDLSYADQHREFEWKTFAGQGGVQRAKVNVKESPLQALARKRDPNGKPFLSREMVAAGERLREDFELSQIGPRITQNWDKFMTGGDRGAFNPAQGQLAGPEAARYRVKAALADLGPGLGDVALRCCCFLEGLEATEKRMGWSARSGKIVLRIALQRLRRHYEEQSGSWSPMIG